MVVETDEVVPEVAEEEEDLNAFPRHLHLPVRETELHI
jgi:hypothetical protein